MKYAGRTIDFLNPRGEPALSAPDSVAWRIFKNPVTLYIGGVAAVLLELAEPRVRTGVWERTAFRKDPVGRMRRTGLAAMISVYGPRSLSSAVIARISERHANVTGVTPCGRPYRADDPELLSWVQATAGFGFLEAYCAYAAALPEAERDRFYREQGPAAAHYGAHDAPKSEAGRKDMFDAFLPDLEPSPVIFEFLRIVRGAPALPSPLTPLQRPLIRAAVDLLPVTVRDRLELGPEYSLRRYEGASIGAAARAAERAPAAFAPPSQACRRMGLPWMWLYRSASKPERVLARSRAAV